MRHQAQLAIPQIGSEGQAKIEEANILIVGVGALGSTVAELLCRTGVRNITLCDYDIIEESNLQRQSLYQSTDIGRLKVEVAKERLIAIDPMCLVTIIAEPFSTKVDVRSFTLIIDGTDALDTRLLLNDVARKMNTPLIIGTASGTSGMLFVVHGSPCWQCITLGKQAVDDCDSGVLGMATHLVATLQASAALRTILGYATKELVEVDAWNFEIRKVHVKENSNCAACTGTYNYSGAQFSLRFCTGANKIMARPNKPRIIHLDKVRNSAAVRKDYGTALLVEVGTGTALVHQHGTIEFSEVSEEDAHAFAKKIEN
jgi:molybdopterin/thiamine biosynthesis adenylyltransferase